MSKHVFVIVTALFTGLLAGSAFGQGDAAAGQAKSALCATCHGADGNSAIAMNPKLAGQNASYLVKQLNDYKSGARVNATMAAMAAGLSDEDIADIAAWYSSQQPTLLGADPARWSSAPRCIAVATRSCRLPPALPVIPPQARAMARPDSRLWAGSTLNTPCCS